MPRRRADEAAVAESDSFLDIVANIVGILIILIVIVGVRVGQSTLATGPSPATTVVTDANAVSGTGVSPVPAPKPSILSTPAPRRLSADPQLLAAIDSTAAKLQELQEQSDKAKDAGAALAATIDEANENRDKLIAEQTEFTRRLAKIKTRADETTKTLAALSDIKQRIHGKLSDVPAENVNVLRHELNPIGRTVRGDEIHFRLAAGRVSHVPLEAFIARLKTRMRENKKRIARVDRHEGRIGPYDGYTMKYVFERGRLNLAEQLRMGSHVVRIRLTGWKVVPQKTLVTETVAEALAPSSRFRRVLRRADSGTTLTFWVYPGSFKQYRRLEQFAHAEGFNVAARPLPRGVPIAGSPNGSRSSSQ